MILVEEQPASRGGFVGAVREQLEVEHLTVQGPSVRLDLQAAKEVLAVVGKAVENPVEGDDVGGIAQLLRDRHFAEVELTRITRRLVSITTHQESCGNGCAWSRAAATQQQIPHTTRWSQIFNAVDGACSRDAWEATTEVERRGAARGSGFSDDDPRATPVHDA